MVCEFHSRRVVLLFLTNRCFVFSLYIAFSMGILMRVILILAFEYHFLFCAVVWCVQCGVGHLKFKLLSLFIAWVSLFEGKQFEN